MRAASGTPVTPMMPHIRWSVSHATGNGREIYLPELPDGLLDVRVTQAHPHGSPTRAYAPDPPRGDAELLGERRNSHRALRCAGHNGAAVGLAEEQLVRGEG